MKSPTILLVEDSEDDAFFFKRVFEKAAIKCSLHHVLNGAEAIKFLQAVSRRRKPELPEKIFLDLKMPVLNGFEFLDWMRSQTFPRAIEVIVLSGSEHEDDKARAVQLGATDYLVKPLRLGDLNRILQHACSPQIGAHV